MRAASLFGVFVIAKVCVLAGRDLPFSGWMPVAYLWQDLLVAGLFAVVDCLLRRSWAGWTAYSLIALYTAVNVPVARVLSTPLTWPLLRAARGPLRDSIIGYVTWTNVALVFLVAASAILLPILLRHLVFRHLAVASVVMIPPVVVLGPYATRQVETMGLHRNVFAILALTAIPRISPEALTEDPRASPFAGAPGQDLSRFRAGAAGRNVVLILLESTAARYLKPYGAVEDPMPHLTQLARKAILFENAYAVYPESIKGLFSVLCSTYPAFDTTPEIYARVRPPSLADVLARAGYRTGLFHSGRFDYLGMDAIVRDRGFQTLEDAGDISGDRQSSFGIDDERVTVTRILNWIDAQPRDKRFFVTYLPIAGHHPYNSPEQGPFPTEEAIDRYRNALHHADVAVGMLLDGLRARGLDQNTLLVLHGDHGQAFGQHPGNFAHTLFIYEENVHVPFLIAAPGFVRDEVRVPQVASLIDTAPTVLDLLGLPSPEAYQGQSLLEDKPRMALFFTDYSLALLGLRDDRWKFIDEVETGRPKLFDLDGDPEEKHDLSAQYPERVQAYRQNLRHWSGAQRKSVLEAR
jgi:arylsulfatase A-like enzyme